MYGSQRGMHTPAMQVVLIASTRGGVTRFRVRAIASISAIPLSIVTADSFSAFRFLSGELFHSTPSRNVVMKQSVSAANVPMSSVVFEVPQILNDCLRMSRCVENTLSNTQWMCCWAFGEPRRGFCMKACNRFALACATVWKVSAS